MKILKRITGIMAVSILMITLVGCQKGSDGKGYIKALLDVAYGKDTKEYTELTGTKEEDADKYMNQSMQAEAEFMAQYYGLDASDKKVTAAFEQLCKKLYDKASYTVEAGSGDKVIVKIKPIMLLVQAQDEIQDYLEEYNVKAYVDGDASATQEKCAKKIAEICISYINKAEYAKEVKVEITVKKSDNKWSVSDEDLNKVDEQIICYDTVSQK